MEGSETKESRRKMFSQRRNKSLEFSAKAERHFTFAKLCRPPNVFQRLPLPEIQFYQIYTAQHND